MIVTLVLSIVAAAGIYTLRRSYLAALPCTQEEIKDIFEVVKVIVIFIITVLAVIILANRLFGGLK